MAWGESKGYKTIKGRDSYVSPPNQLIKMLSHISLLNPIAYSMNIGYVKSIYPTFHSALDPTKVALSSTPSLQANANTNKNDLSTE